MDCVGKIKELLYLELKEKNSIFKNLTPQDVYSKSEKWQDALSNFEKKYPKFNELVELSALYNYHAFENEMNFIKHMIGVFMLILGVSEDFLFYGIAKNFADC